MRGSSVSSCSTRASCLCCSRSATQRLSRTSRVVSPVRISESACLSALTKFLALSRDCRDACEDEVIFGAVDTKEQCIMNTRFIVARMMRTRCQKLRYKNALLHSRIQLSLLLNKVTDFSAFKAKRMSKITFAYCVVIFL